MSEQEAFDNADNNFSSSIQPHHLTEWRSSSVDDRLTVLNVLSLKGTEPKNHLFCFLPNSERRNHLSRTRDKWLRRYDHTEAGGYWISGLDPITIGKNGTLDALSQILPASMKKANQSNMNLNQRAKVTPPILMFHLTSGTK